MRRTLIFCFLQSFTLFLFSQESKPPMSQPIITAKWSPAGLFLGSLSLQAEYNFGGRNSLTARIGLPVNAKQTMTWDGKDADFNMKATSFLAGYRTYFSRAKHLKGLYYEPFFKYVNHTSEGKGMATMNNRTATFSFMNNYNGIGIGMQLGAQFFVGKRFVIDLFLIGPEINSASNSFKATEVGNANPWTYTDVKEAENNLREFIDDLPFIRNKTSIMINRDTKRVSADFKGALPGIRTGVSFGLAF